MLKNLPIRYKMTFFYLAFTALLMGVFLPFLYFTTQNILLQNQKDILRLSHSQLSSQVEEADGFLFLEQNVDLSQISGYLITYMNGTKIAEKSMPLWAEALPFSIGEMREVREHDGDWYILDGITQEDGIDVCIRAILSLSVISETLRIIRVVSLIAVPIFAILSFCGGLWITKKSFRPVDRIISATRIIAQGDLSQRINEVRTKDEIGELAAMMNKMLDNIEVSFAKEKRFASDASHELRTPVSIMMAYTEALLETKMPDDSNKSLQVIYDEARRMERIIAQLLMITRGLEKSYPFEIEFLNINEIIESVAEMLLEKAADRDISITVDVKDSITLKGDQSLLTQMMLNLIDNSIKYGRNGGKVHISAGKVGEHCEICVMDNGIGVAKEHLTHLFERFYRVDSARDRSGTGLGLSIVQWIVSLHKGSIHVSSELEQGTTFKIYF